MTYNLDHLPEVQAAMEAAASCQTIAELQAAVHAFDAHPLCQSPAMPGRAGERCTMQNPVMILGKSPAGTETETRVPFSGPAGRVLREEMELAGLDIEACWITCATPWRARKDNNPNSTQLAFSRPFLFREIELVRPSVILCLGQKADEALTQKAEPLGDKPGTSWTFTAPDGFEVEARVLWCHAYVMYGRPERSPVFRDHLLAAARDHEDSFAPVLKRAA